MKKTMIAEAQVAGQRGPSPALGPGQLRHSGSMRVGQTEPPRKASGANAGDLGHARSRLFSCPLLATCGTIACSLWQ